MPSTTYATPARDRDGCRVAPACLDCPLPRCIYEQDWPGSAPETRARDAELARLSREGWTAARLAARYGITRRHVRRVLAAQREEARPC